MREHPTSAPGTGGVAERIAALAGSDRTHYCVGIVLLAGGLAHLIGSYLDWSNLAAMPLAIALGFAIIASGFGRRPSDARGFALLWSAIPLVLIGVWYYFVVSFGSFDLAAIVFHYQLGIDSPLVVLDYLMEAIPIILGLLAVLGGLAILVKRDRRLRRIERFAVLPLLLLNPALPQIISTAQGEVRVDDRFATYYVDPAAIEAPTGKRLNYIHIFLESAERSYFDSQFGDVMAPLAPFEARGVSATDLRQTAGTGWSSAGIAAANCGVPMFLPGLFNRIYFRHARDFLPGTTCTGDLLSRDGYNLSYVMGAEMSFGGIGHLFSTHGDYTLIGPEEMRQRYGGPETSWGPDDGIVLEAAFDEIARLSALGKPFSLSVDTAGGHAPAGYLAGACRDIPGIADLEPPILAGLKCTNSLAARLLARLEKARLLSDTVVVVQSDHLAMRNPLTDRLDALPRRNLFFAFGEGISPRTLDRTASPADIMPTVLTLLGYRLDQGAAGLGISLLSDRPTLLERMGQDEYDDAVLEDGVLGPRFWMTEQAQGS